MNSVPSVLWLPTYLAHTRSIRICCAAEITLILIYSAASARKREFQRPTLGRGLLGEVDEEGRQVGERVVLVDVDGGGDAAQVDGADDHGAVDGEGSGAVVAQGGAGG